MEPGEVVFNDRLQATGLTVALTCTVPNTTCSVDGTGREGTGNDRVPQQWPVNPMHELAARFLHHREHAGCYRKSLVDRRGAAELGRRVIGWLTTNTFHTAF